VPEEEEAEVEAAPAEQPEMMAEEPQELPTPVPEEEEAEAEAAPVEQPEMMAEEPQELPTPAPEEEEAEIEAAPVEQPEMMAEEPQELPTPVPEEGKEKEEDSALYEGTVELAIPPPVGLDRMLQLHKNLRHIPQIEVMNLGVSKDKGITIRLFLDSPIPLLKLLGDLPEVEKVSEPLGGAKKAADSQKAAGKPSPRKIIVTTRK
jgi:hypothetical protein